MTRLDCWLLRSAFVIGAIDLVLLTFLYYSTR